MKKLLIAGDLKPLMTSSMAFLRRADITVLTAATNDEILRAHLTEQANLIVTKHDLPGLAAETLIHTIRRSESMRAVSIIVLCDAAPHNRDRYTGSGVNAVLAGPVDPALFAGKVQDLLDVAPRRHYRVVLNVAVDGMHNNRPFVCSSQNVSAKGMLIRTAEAIPVGGRIACSFYLPDGKRLSAAGEIVRTVKENSGSPYHQYGVRFLSLDASAEAALASFVDREHRRHFVEGRDAAAPAA